MSPARRTPRSVIHLSAVIQLSAVPPGTPTWPTIPDRAVRHRPGPRPMAIFRATPPPNPPGDPTVGSGRRRHPAAVPPGPAPDADGGPFDAPWYPHGHPERPFDQWCSLCTCRSCQVALRATATARPQLALVVRSPADRLVVTAELAARARARDGTLDRLVHVDGDSIHQVRVATGAPDVPPAYDRRSLVAADAGDPRAFRRFADLVPPHGPEPAA
jgi:hypothetical protein